jgi:hypothetical protein
VVDRRIEQGLSKVSRIETKLKGLLAAIALGSALIVAAPASAGPVYLKTDGIYQWGTAHINSPVGASLTINENAATGPLWFTAALGTGPSGTSFDFLGFCVDIYHNITAGFGSQAALNLQYQQGDLKYDGDGHLLTTQQINKISHLVQLGTNIWNAGGVGPHVLTASAATDLQGIQEAIWRIEGAVLTGGSASTQHFFDIADGNYAGQVKIVYNYDQSLTAASTRRGNQTFAYSVAAVPEPATWGLLIIGFGGIGALLRRRRGEAATA